MSLPNNAKKVFEGVMFNVYQWEQEQFDGSTKTFEAVKRKESVQLIATTKDKKLILLEEEQPHAGKFLSLPGGICDTNNPEEDGKRELLEETGMACEELKHWKTTGFSSKVVWNNNYYIAKNCYKTSKENLDAGEKIEVFLLDFDEFIEKVTTDEFRNKEFTLMILKMIQNNTLQSFKEMLFK